MSVAIDQVFDQPRIKQVRASAGQTAFDYPFAIFASSDLRVNVDGTDLAPTAYSVSGVGDDNGGTVTLNTGANLDALVTIYADTAIDRLTDYQFRGRFDTERFNNELDKMTVNLQELRDQVRRALRLGITGEISDPAELQIPSLKTARAGRLLGFGDAGEVVTHALEYRLEAEPRPLDTIATMRALVAPVNGDAVLVLEEGRGGLFVFDTSETGAADNGITFKADDATTGSWVRRFSGRVDVRWFGVDTTGSTDVAPAFQQIADLQRPVSVPAGRYLLADEVVLPTRFDWYFDDDAVIVNGLVSSLGTTDALFLAEGSAVSVTTLTAAFTRGLSPVVTVASAAGITVGDLLAFADTVTGVEQFHAVVVSISGTSITLDRTPSCDLANGGSILKVSPVSGRFHGAEFDFNGSTASPRYGFGFRARYHRHLYVSRIRARNIGSKVVELSRGCDSTVEQVICRGATNPSEGGHGYVLRVANSNDCLVREAQGSGQCRHIVDFTAASRNVAALCKGNDSLSADFLTHFNGCVGNRFIACDSINNTTAAYSITPASGDEDNIVLGGRVINGAIDRPNAATSGNQYKGNRFIGLYAETRRAIAPINASGHYVDCHIRTYTTSNIIRDSLGAIVLEFVGGTMEMADPTISGRIAVLTNAASDVRLIGATLDLHKTFRVFDANNSAIRVRLDGCRVVHRDPGPAGNNESMVWGSFNAEFIDCVMVGISGRFTFSTGAGNALRLRNCRAPDYVNVTARDSGGNEVNVNIDQQTLWSVPARGLGTFTVQAPFNYELQGSATYDPPSLADGAGVTTTVTVTDAVLGEFAVASFSLDLQGITLTAWVSATNTVSVRFQNETGGTIDLASGTLRALVRRL